MTTTIGERLPNNYRTLTYHDKIAIDDAMLFHLSHTLCAAPTTVVTPPHRVFQKTGGPPEAAQQVEVVLHHDYTMTLSTRPRSTLSEEQPCLAVVRRCPYVGQMSRPITAATVQITHHWSKDR